MGEAEAQELEAMTNYKHKQMGTLVLGSMGAFLIASLLGWVLEPDTRPVLGTVFVVILVLMALFGTLTTEVSKESLRVAFGFGLIRRTIALSRIESVSVVRNRWYYGWGIRLTPHGWLFNVSGFDAVELQLTSGKKFRIGTDEPKALVKALRKLLPAGEAGSVG
ncbi:MAG: hypothetical protein ACI8QC_001353 [Planctomycetota bacterium]